MPLVAKSFADIFSFARASKAWDYGANRTLLEHGNDTIRQGYDPATGAPAGWRIEGTATNGIRNPRCEGAVVGIVGDTGAGPTYTGIIDPRSIGVTASIVGSGVEDGIGYFDLRYQGNPTGGSAARNDHDGGSGVGAVAGQPVVHSAYVRLIAGTLTNIALQIEVREFNGGTPSGGLSGTVITPTAAPLATQRFFHTRTLTDAAATNARGTLRVGTTAGPIDATLRIGGMQVENNVFASSLILPPPAAPAMSTRNQDNFMLASSAFASAFGNGNAGFLIMDAMLATSFFQGQGRTFADLSDGTNTNRLQFRLNSTGSSLISLPVTGGVTGAVVSAPGAPNYSTPSRVGLRWNNGAHAVCLNGGALASGSGAPLAFNQMQLGLDTSRNNGTALQGRIREIHAGVVVPPDAKFIAACVPGANIAQALAA